MVYCATRDAIKNKVMQGYVCPASQQHCPYGQGDIRIVIEQINSIYKREWEWPESMLLPTEDAKDWHCKYKVEVSDKTLRKADGKSLNDDEKENMNQGYLVVDVKMRGFENDAYLILQSHDDFVDVKEDQSEDEKQRVVAIEDGVKYILPGEMDALITFAPIGNSEGR